MSYFELDKNDFQKVASKHDLKATDVEEIYFKYFETIKNFMALKTMPRIKTEILRLNPSFFRFKRKFKKLRSINHKENLKEHLKSFWHVMERMKNESIGKATFLQWRSLERASLKTKDKSLYELISKKFSK